jgi:CO/xanthine dehydrogenase Mo-binding subunit
MSGETFRVIGQRVRKVDGLELVTGRAKFTGDLRFPGMVYGYAARASVPAARIRSLDVSAAEKAEGVLLVLKGGDIPGGNLIGILPPFDQPVLATEVIRYAGESLALVVAETAEAAKRGARLVKADLEPLTPILSIDAALAEGARAIHPKGNVTCANKLVKGDVEKGFAGADVVVEGTYETANQEHGYLEPEAVCAVPSADGRMTVYASCQSPFHIRGHVAANLGVPASSVRVVQAYTGGSFGGKDDVAAEIGTLAAVAARRLERPVMIAHEREESIIGSNLRHASRIHVATAAKKDGTILARRVRVLLDGGAYASESPFVTVKALVHVAGPYRVPNLSVESTSVYTNKTYCGACRGFGVPQATFASESNIDELARKLGMDPLALRRKNALVAGDANATGQTYPGSVGIVQTIDAVEARAARAARASGERRPLPPRPRRGVPAAGHLERCRGRRRGRRERPGLAGRQRAGRPRALRHGPGRAHGVRADRFRGPGHPAGAGDGPSGRHGRRARLGPHGRLPKHHGRRPGGEDGGHRGAEVPRRHGREDVQGRGAPRRPARRVRRAHG